MLCFYRKALAAVPRNPVRGIVPAQVDKNLFTPGSAEPEHVLQRPTGIGPFFTSRYQQLGHTLVYALMRGDLLDGGPIELNCARRAVPMHRRLHGARHIQVWLGLAHIVTRQLWRSSRRGNTVACSIAGVAQRRRTRHLVINRFRCCLRFCLARLRSPRPHRIGLERGHCRDYRRLRHLIRSLAAPARWSKGLDYGSNLLRWQGCDGCDARRAFRLTCHG